MGGTVWFGWFWFLSLWKEAVDGCPACMWLGIDGVSVLHAEYDSDGFNRFGAGYDSLFFSSLNDGVKFNCSVFVAFSTALPAYRHRWVTSLFQGRRAE